VLQVRGSWPGTAPCSDPLQYPALLPFVCYTPSVFPHLLIRVTLLSLGWFHGCCHLLACRTFSHTVPTRGRKPFPKGEIAFERTGNVRRGLLWERKCRREFCAAAGSP